jgi:hypothetical protein
MKVRGKLLIGSRYSRKSPAGFITLEVTAEVRINTKLKIRVSDFTSVSVPERNIRYTGNIANYFQEHH